jgi:hypothetical protein
MATAKWTLLPGEYTGDRAESADAGKRGRGSIRLSIPLSAWSYRGIGGCPLLDLCNGFVGCVPYQEPLSIIIAGICLCSFFQQWNHIFPAETADGTHDS